MSDEFKVVWSNKSYSCTNSNKETKKKSRSMFVVIFRPYHWKMWNVFDIGCYRCERRNRPGAGDSLESATRYPCRPRLLFFSSSSPSFNIEKKIAIWKVVAAKTTLFTTSLRPID